jgi:AP-3 complex subunit delta-1
LPIQWCGLCRGADLLQFATLTPLEPRLIKKLLPPLTTLIKTTPAMSLLYECINGIVQGGILDGSEGLAEGEEIARLCVGKLRSMLVVEGDPNREFGRREPCSNTDRFLVKYVALLAFQKIVTSHPHLVSLHQDVILECIDDPDISIRMRALDLAAGMVNADNLAMIVETLVRQLLNAPVASLADDSANDRGMHSGVEPLAESDDEDAEESLKNREIKSEKPPPLPEEYRINAIRSILDMCSRDTYSNVTDFEWYIAVLVKLVKACPSVKVADSIDTDSGPSSGLPRDISFDIGYELQNVAVRVKSMRPEATAAAQTVLMIDTRDQFFPPFGNGGRGVLESCVWIAGEYPEQLTDPDGVLNSLLHSSNSQLPSDVLAVYIHAVLKVFASMCGDQQISWSPSRRTNLTLLMARIVYFLEPLAAHPDLDVQERAVEYLELMKLASEAASGHAVSEGGEFAEPPLLLTQAIPALFSGMELNPVAVGALRKVPPPDGLDLSVPINDSLSGILRQADEDDSIVDHNDGFQQFYTERLQITTATPAAAADRLDMAAKSEATSYQYTSDDDRLGPDALARKNAERRDKYKDDPFYIGHDDDNSASSRLHNIIKNTNGEDLDVDSIPIMDLDLDARSGARTPLDHEAALRQDRQRRAVQRKRVEITGDENIDGEDTSRSSSRPDINRSLPSRAKKSLLQVDSSGLGSLSLEGDSRGEALDIEQREAEEKAMREVERLRLEMQRASERIQAKEESVVVRKKKTKRRSPKAAEAVEADAFPQDDEGVVERKKKKKKKKAAVHEDGVEEANVLPGSGEAVAKTKTKKRRQIDMTSL